MTISNSNSEVVSEDLPSNPFSFEVLALGRKQKSNAKRRDIFRIILTLHSRRS
jgi:hypothetical protein